MDVQEATYLHRQDIGCEDDWRQKWQMTSVYDTSEVDRTSVVDGGYIIFWFIE